MSRGPKPAPEWKAEERGIRGTDAVLIRFGAISVPLFHPGGNTVSSATVDPDSIGIPAGSHVPETGYREGQLRRNCIILARDHIAVNIIDNYRKEEKAAVASLVLPPFHHLWRSG